MAGKDIAKMLQKSKAALEKEHKASVKSVRSRLDSFKKKTLSQV